MKANNLVNTFKYSKFNTAGHRLSCNPISQEKCIHSLAVFIFEDNMRTCKIEGCNNKHRVKGLCAQHYNKQYRQDNKKQIAKRMKKYQQKYKRVAYFRQYYQENKEYLLKYSEQWRIDNLDYFIEYRKNNKEHIAKRIKKYFQTPAGRARTKASYHNRRILTKGLTIAIVQSVYEDNIKKYGRLTCILCFKPIEFGKDSLEHLTPLSRGGSNDYDNLGIAHLSCNKKKHTMTLSEWFKIKITAN